MCRQKLNQIASLILRNSKTLDERIEIENQVTASSLINSLENCNAIYSRLSYASLSF